MSDDTTLLTDPVVRAYLTEVHRSVAAVDPSLADGVLTGVADHLRDAAADAAAEGRPLDVDVLLRELGDPAVIAAGIDRPDALPASDDARTSDSSGGVILTVLLLTIGTSLFTVLGWAVGIWLLWSTSRWTRTDKLVGTAAWPAALGLSFVVSGIFGGTGVSGWHLLILLSVVAPYGVGVVLLVRGLRRTRTAHRARPAPVARNGAAGLLDRWPAGVAAAAAPALAAVVVLVPAFAYGSWAGLAATAVVAVLVAAVGVVVLWTSRGWTIGMRTAGTVTSAVVAAAVYGTVSAAIAAVAPLRQCGADGCETLPARLAADGELLTSVAATVIPAAIIHAVMVATTFRSGAFAARRGGDAAPAWSAVVLLLLGASGLAALAAVRHGSSGFTGLAIAGTAAWTVGAVLLWRSTSLREIDRAVSTLPTAVATGVMLFGVGFGMFTSPPNPADPLLPPTVPFSTAVAFGVVCGLQIAASVWLVARRRVRVARDAQPAPRVRP